MADADSENDGIGGYTVVKHSWRGRYRRLFSITDKLVATYNPTTLEVTNSWTYGEVSSVSISPKIGPNHFTISAPKQKSKNISNMVFESVHVREILTNVLSKYSHLKAFNNIMNQLRPGSKIHPNGELHPIMVLCAPASLDVWSTTTKKKVASYSYIDIEEIHHISDLRDGVCIKTRFDGRMHGLVCTNSRDVVRSMIDNASFHLNITLQCSTAITVGKFLDERLGTLGTDDSLMLFCTFPVHKLTNRYSNPVARIIGVSETCIVEHDPNTYVVVRSRSLKRIYSFIRYQHNPQMFGIEWVDGTPSRSIYTCTERDSLIATFLDVIRLSGTPHVFVKSTPTNLSRRYAPLSKNVDEDVEIMCMKLLTSNFSRNLDFVVNFNHNIPYTGFVHAHTPDSLFGEKKEKVILNALNSIIQFECDFANLTPVQVENLFFALKRLFSTKVGFDSFSLVPKLHERIGSLIVSGLRMSDASVTYATVEVLISLILPMHAFADLYQEQQNKLSILSDKRFVKGLLDILKTHILRGTNTLVVSSLLDFFTYVVCMPFSQTTDQIQFDVTVSLITDIGYPLFRLFQHTSPSIVKSAGLIVKSIIEEAPPEVASTIQKLALTEGVFPKHLLISLFTQTSSKNLADVKYLLNRKLSRRLIALWLRDSPFCLMLMKRALPLGIINFLYSTEKSSSTESSRFAERPEIVHENENKKTVEVFVQNAVQKVEDFFKHWHSKVVDRLGYPTKQEMLRVLTLRESKLVLPPKENWDLMYEKFYQDHWLPDLIWNHKTREELRDSLEVEIRAFNIDKELGGSKRICWNFDDFEVRYATLQNEIKIGDYYVRPLLESADFRLSTSEVFFSDLYHVFLQSLDGEEKKYCLRAMTKVFAKYHKAIGKFNDTPHIIKLLRECRSAHERDLYLLLIKELVNEKENARNLIDSNSISVFVDLASLAHLHTTRAHVPLQTLMLEGSYEQRFTETEEWNLNEVNQYKDPVSLSTIKKLYDNKVINSSVSLWASGMEGWKSLCEISQLKWTIMETGPPILNPSELCVTIIDTFLKISSFFPNVDGNGGVVRPTHRIKRLLSDVRSLPHISQLLLTFDPAIVERVAELLHDVLIENPVLPQLFITGLYFFLLMYTGSNISPIAKFLKYTHLKQGFQGDISKKRNVLLANSILSPLLPEAMISFLESNESQKFAEVFLGEFDTPEVIWSNKMRRFMMEKISLHLSDFTPRLKINVKAVYMYCPIPHIEYEELKDELFCGKYYLKNLCDTTRFPNWSISDPVQTLRDVLDAWKEELNKKTPPMSLDEAFEILGLTPGQRHEDIVIRKAYFKLASKYHPDKNPEGREMFEKIVKSYEFICSNHAKSTAPSACKITLILKSQIILFVNHKKDLAPYKYPGYPMLLNTIEIEINSPQLFSHSATESLLLPAVQLVHSTICCSVLNAEELRRENGINVLHSVFEKCTPMIGIMSKPTDMNVLVTESVVRCFTASCLFKGFLDEILKFPTVLSNLSGVLLLHEILPAFCCTTMEFLISLCCDINVQIRIFTSGLLFHMIYFLFFYDYTLAEGGVEAFLDSNFQLQYNELARLSFQGLSIMSVSSQEEENNSGISISLKKMLTEYVVNKMVTSSPSEMLKALNSNVESPYMIWNNSTRAQLKSLLETIRVYSSDKEEEYYNMILDFEYRERANELIIGGVYINILNKLPSSEIEDPNQLSIDIIAFICGSAHHFFEETAASVQEVMDRQERIKNLTAASNSLLNLLTRFSVFSVVKPADFTLMLSYFVHNDCAELQSAILKVIHVLSKDSSSVEKMAEVSVMGYFNLALQSLVKDRMITLSIFQALFSNTRLVKESISRGTILFLLHMFCFDKDVAVRGLIIELLARLMTDRLSGPRIKIITSKFFPSIFIDAILDDYQAATLLYEGCHENPELTWNDETRKKVADTIEEMKESLYKSQLANIDAEWKIPDNFTCSSTKDSELIIAGVHVGRFVAQPTWVLRHPKMFIVGLFDRLCDHFNAVAEEKAEDDEQDRTTEMVANAICLLIEANQTIADYIPALGHLNVVIKCMSEFAVGDKRIKYALMVLRSCVPNSLCMVEIQKNQNWLGTILDSFRKRPDCAYIAAETVNKAFSGNLFSSLVAHALHSGCIKIILNLLDSSFSEVSEPSATRANLVGALQSMERNPVHEEEVKEVLNGWPSWSQYKNQRHDLFLENPNSVLRVQAATAGIAGYLTAAHGSAASSISNMSTLKMLTSSAPPKKIPDNK